jgi:thiosulfate/3-mercaptopyruvate sulfurtransferase
MYSTLIQVDELQALIRDGKKLMVFDCSFDLMNPSEGVKLFESAHIPGAVYADLDANLSAKGDTTAASGGRHPLPSREKFAAWLNSVGFSSDMQAVVYDRNNSTYCGRLWWMLQWAGHEAVALLDGGLQAWQKADGNVESGAQTARPAGKFTLSAELYSLFATKDVAGNLGKPAQTVMDARAAARYRGDTEPLDPQAGHVPGALNRPFTDNLGPDGKFKPADVLKAEFETVLAGRNPATVVHHCGSGVTATPNILAMNLAGLGKTGLYAGSWSEWSSTPGLPVAIG